MTEFEKLLNKDGNDNPDYFPFNWERKYWGDKVTQDDSLEDEYEPRINWDKFANIHHKSEKAKKRARMAADARIKKSRFRKAKNGTYGYGAGWCVRNKRFVGTYEDVYIPKHTKEVTVITGTRNELHQYGHEKPYYVTVPIFEKKTKVVPSRTVRKCVKREYVETEPYLKRFSVRKKYYKKYAAKKARKAEFADGAGYKKIYSIAWEIW